MAALMARPRFQWQPFGPNLHHVSGGLQDRFFAFCSLGGLQAGVVRHQATSLRVADLRVGPLDAEGYVRGGVG